MVRHLGEGDCKITVHGLYEQASRTKFKQMKEKAESVGKLACINSDSGFSYFSKDGRTAVKSI